MKSNHTHERKNSTSLWADCGPHPSHAQCTVAGRAVRLKASELSEESEICARASRENGWWITSGSNSVGLLTTDSWEKSGKNKVIAIQRRSCHLPQHKAPCVLQLLERPLSRELECSKGGHIVAPFHSQCTCPEAKRVMGNVSTSQPSPPCCISNVKNNHPDSHATSQWIAVVLFCCLYLIWNWYMELETL